MRVAIYGEADQVEEFLELWANKGSCAFCISDIAKGKELEIKYNAVFYTCYLRMADAIEKGGTYLCLKEIPDTDIITLFKKGLCVVFAEDFYVPAPIASYDNSYKFEFEQIADIIKENESYFIVADYLDEHDWSPVDLDTVKFDINKSSCRNLAKNISRLVRFGYTDLINRIHEDPASALGLIMSDRSKNDIDMDHLCEYICNKDFGTEKSYCVSQMQDHIDQTAKIVKEVVKYFKEN